MHKRLHLIGLGCCSLLLVGCLGSSSENAQGGKLTQLKQRELEQSIMFLEGNLGSLTGVGYTQWTPTTAATELVATMNASQTLLPEEIEEYEEAGIKPREGIPYVLNEPSDRWQVVLVPDDDNQVIHVQGYGRDLETPLITEELPCCAY